LRLRFEFQEVENCNSQSLPGSVIPSLAIIFGINHVVFLSAVGFSICTAMNSLKMTVFANKAVFPHMEDVVLLENFVREEFLRLNSLTLTEWTTYLRRSRAGSRNASTADSAGSRSPKRVGSGSSLAAIVNNPCVQ
jgi:hypothetical protein